MKRFCDICDHLGLGALTESPRRLTGGLMHRMYSLSTARGRYAEKLLNPNIMARPQAMNNFRSAEALEAQLEQAGIPILPALRFGGNKMQELSGQYLYVFDWFDGRALRSEEVREEHCRAIAEQLARIHAIARREEVCESSADEIDWEFFARRLPAKNPELGALLSRNLDMLREIEGRARLSLPKLPKVAAICHNDMDCKNVLWNGDAFRIIDLECLGWSNPFIELYETALCWSGIEQCNVDPKLFEAFIRAYGEAGGELPDRWTPIHDANCGRLSWLEYNLKRALGMSCAEEEIALGASEVRKVLSQLIHYQEIRKRLD